jgi:hypothetical protein
LDAKYFRLGKEISTVAKDKGKIILDERTVVQRINRRLKASGEQLKVPRGKAVDQIGAYYVISVKQQTITHRGDDLEAFARKLGALQPWETLAS